MKRFIKKSNRKGFTLVETLLATVILVVVSTMLFNGFIATMGYSYQTSVYSKSSGKNYEACMSKVSSWSHLENKGDDGREVAGKNYYDTHGHSNTELIFDCSGWPYSLETVYVGIEKHDDISLTVPDSVKGYEFAPKDNQYADNRTTFYYYPEYWQGSSSSSLGQIVVMYQQSTNKYYWVVDTGSANLHGAEKVVTTPIH